MYIHVYMTLCQFKLVLLHVIVCDAIRAEFVGEQDSSERGTEETGPAAPLQLSFTREGVFKHCRLSNSQQCRLVHSTAPYITPLCTIT